ncbi:glycosyltransferase [Flavobacterium sp.]|uniref:glycosyltransferase family 2 protein n=1 Tax=Flavobacterium sp. TaxID=239 RepID=UPI0026082F13|nr:glycosyltransferase [Flavobacterium sp.]
MKFELNEFITASGESILYCGEPDLERFDQLAAGPGDVWHSSFEQGYKNAFPELVYQTAVMFWYLNDFDDLEQCVSWRINPNQFAVRKSVWESTRGFDADYENIQMQALDFGFRTIRYLGVVPLYVKQLFRSTTEENITISARDRYTFFLKNFRKRHAVFMLYRTGLWKMNEWNAYFYASNHFSLQEHTAIVAPRKLHQVAGNPWVNYIIPTMLRQEFTLQLLEDLRNQTYKPSRVIVVDATPVAQRDESLYNKNYPFELIVIWQQSEGSCRARNEAIECCLGDYVIFGDDDIRIAEDFIENHIRLLQTYNAEACNGLDIRAKHHEQTLDDLKQAISMLKPQHKIVGTAQMFSNANSCVKYSLVKTLIGNDVNFDGGYGEDSDFGMSLTKIGATVLNNPFSANLHLKPPAGGYRFWGTQAKVTGKKRKKQPWELDTPVKWIRPVPSPTVMYGIMKQFTPQQLLEYKYKHFSYYLFDGSKSGFLYRLIRIPYKNLQFRKSVFYAKKLIKSGTRYK